MARVKICGITNLPDALKAHDEGADFLGFVFFKKSPRQLDMAEARLIIRGLPKNALRVGLFLDEDINDVMITAEKCELDFIQLHGREDPGYAARLKKKNFKVIKSFKVKDKSSLENVEDYADYADYYLFDTYVEGAPGGTGTSFDWNILKGKAFKRPIFLAGGLTPKNVAGAINRVSPYAVDVASGVESSPGKKDYKLLQEFIQNAKEM